MRCLFAPCPFCRSSPQIYGVSKVTFFAGHVTILKEADVPWDKLENVCKLEISNYLEWCATHSSSSPSSSFAVASSSTLPGTSSAPAAEVSVAEKTAVAAGGGDPSNAPEEEEEDVQSAIRMLLHTRVRPMVQEDGGDVELIRFDAATGTVWVWMKGACEG
eukprot:GHVT01062566.1.p1 GENE.GHVT01062566.1~~GHVT01062566.1.p1  ORF type:complete len:161 (+),score=42.23 GHVT01062566.1:825-1307(+)